MTSAPISGARTILDTCGLGIDPNRTDGAQSQFNALIASCTLCSASARGRPAGTISPIR